MPIGKSVADKLYIHVSRLPELDTFLQQTISEALQGVTVRPDEDFNVLRVRENRDEVTLLHYPAFFTEAFPALARSWRIHLPTRLVRFRDYSQSLNPPILHRKELLLSPEHPDYATWAALTSSAEGLGLFEDPRRIGFKAHWEELIRRRGYRVTGHDLVPVGNAEPSDAMEPTEFIQLQVEVQRHLTALSRTTLSAPVQSLLRHELLSPEKTFFDYGCGQGDDLRGLAELGVCGTGWDPYHRPEGIRTEAHVVNLGFVINVIEDFDERVEALLGAYKLCHEVLAVSAMLDGARAPGRPFRDGILTGRNTFQKYYTQAQLQQFIESVLDEEAIPAAPGVFYVFRDRAAEQCHLLRRHGSRLRVAPPKSPAPMLDPIVAGQLTTLWNRSLELGRAPEPDEVQGLDALVDHFGSWGRAIRHCLRNNDAAALERSAQCRRDDIRVALAVARFSRRQRFRELESSLQRTIKALFGSLSVAEREAQELLFSVADTTKLNAACEQAAALGLGYLEPGQSLQLHTSLVQRLPPILRVYVACATALFGDVTGVDLVKLHITSGKVTLMRFDDFVNRPLPAMVERVKVKLKELDLDLFQYGEAYPPTLLYEKSRYINEEFPFYAEQVAFEEALHELSIADLSGYGPPAQELDAALTRARWVVDGFRLERSRTVPDMDARCSQFFTYRQLIHAGDTWKQTQVANIPVAPATYNALADLARYILDPVVEYYGAIEITYGFCSAALARQMEGGIAPKLDQHAAHELNRRGQLICERGGAAVDFLIRDEDMFEVSEWIAAHLPFDRLYYYGPARPVHVSFGPQAKREVIDIEERNGRRIPRRRPHPYPFSAPACVRTKQRTTPEW